MQEWAGFKPLSDIPGMTEEHKLQTLVSFIEFLIIAGHAKVTSTGGVSFNMHPLNINQTAHLYGYFNRVMEDARHFHPDVYKKIPETLLSLKMDRYGSKEFYDDLGNNACLLDL